MTKLVKIDVLLYEVPCIISYAELTRESISDIMQNLALFDQYFQFLYKLCNFC